MALPKLSHPIYELALPSSKKVIKYRPFLVKEEKLLLMAQSGNDTKEVIGTIKQVINNCILSEDVSVDELTSFDIEYIFIKLRSKSIGNIIELTYRDLEDDKKYDVTVDLENVEIVFNEKHDPKIEINKTTGLTLKYPSVESSVNALADEETSDAIFDLIGKSIESIYDENGVYNPKDYSDEEILEFVSSLSIEAFQKIQEFFTTMPKLHYEIKYTNSLGNEKTITLNTLNDFFTLG
jgi:hypothetical protein